MRIEIDPAALDDPSAQAHIDALVDRLGVHDVTVTDFDALPGSRWGQRNPKRVSDLQDSVAGPPHHGPAAGPVLHRTVLRVVDAASAEAARKLACNPLVVLLEDEEADGWFLGQVIAHMGGGLAKLWAWCVAATPAAIDVRSASLDLMPVRIRKLKARADDQGRPPRLVVIHDSDRRWPTDKSSQKSWDAVAEAYADQPQVLPTAGGTQEPQCLKKRAIENYIPDGVFESIKAATLIQKWRDAVDALLALAPTQRDHFPMKKALKQEERDHSLYDGANLAPLLNNDLFPKRPRPMVFLQESGHAGAITARGLRLRDGQGEWDDLLQHIADAL